MNKSVSVETIPKTQWAASMQEVGFSKTASESFANMTALTLEAGGSWSEEVVKGKTSPSDYFKNLIP